MDQIVGSFLVVCIFLVFIVFGRHPIAEIGRIVHAVRGEAPASSPGGTRGPGITLYRSSNGRSDYKFRIQRVDNGSYRVYVLDHPSFGSRTTSDIAIHLLRDRQGRYICFTGRIENERQAHNLAATWANKIEEFILHGQRF